MAASIQVKRGATAKVAAYTPLSGELVLDTTTNKLYAGDGSTAGGNQIVASRKGVTDGTDAATGEVGELISNQTSGTSVTSGTAFNATSISLTPGDWDVTGVIRFDPSAAVLTVAVGGVTPTSATQPGFPYAAQSSFGSASSTQQMPVPTRRVSITANTTFYLVGVATFGSGTVTANGFLRARRVR